MTGKKIAALAVATILLLAVCIWGINSMIRVGDEGEIRTVQDAVRHAALTCFAVYSESICKVPWGIWRIRSRRWINDVTKE